MRRRGAWMWPVGTVLAALMAGCSVLSGADPGSATRGLSLEVWLRGEENLAVLYRVEPAGTIGFGGGAVCALAAARPSAALILMSAFANVRSFAKSFLVPGFLVRDPFDNLSVVNAYPNPILVIHGKFDEIIPYRHGHMLFKAARQGKMLSYDCGHNDCMPGQGTFWPDIESFLREAEILSAS